MNYKINSTLYSDYSGWIKVVTPYDESISNAHSLEICKHIKYSKLLHGNDKFIKLKIVRKILDFEVVGSYMIYSFFVKQEDELNIKHAFMSHDTEVKFIVDYKEIV